MQIDISTNGDAYSVFMYVCRAKMQNEHETDAELGEPVDGPLLKTPAKIDSENDRFPFCIVWSPLPVITWFLPFIGHMGIADAQG